MTLWRGNEWAFQQAVVLANHDMRQLSTPRTSVFSPYLEKGDDMKLPRRMDVRLTQIDYAKHLAHARYRVGVQ